MGFALGGLRSGVCLPWAAGAQAAVLAYTAGMIRLSANLSFLWPEIPALERFGAAQRAGFQYVEMLFPYEESSAVLSELLMAHGLSLQLINAPAGVWAAGERGFACLPSRRSEFQASVGQALEYAVALDVPLVHLMAGRLPEGLVPESPAAEPYWQCYRESLAWACREAATVGKTITIEPLNRRDQPGYLLADLDSAVATIEGLGHPGLRLQFDVYHQQVSRGDIFRSLDHCRRLIAHIQIAGAPLRHEPQLGELSLPRLLQHIEGLGYEGCVGLEYLPSHSPTDDGLAWAQPYLHRASA